jgi:hypothetical protein
MMSFLTYITGFLWTLNFCLFWPIMQIRKKGGCNWKKSSSLKLLSHSLPIFAEMILVCSPFKIVSVSAVLYPRWPPWLKIEISSNGQNCSILSQKVPKFELYEHNDELFNMYYRIFLWILSFCLFWPIMQIRKMGEWNLKTSSPLKLLSQSQPNFAEMILGWSSSKIVSGISEHRPRWPPQSNLI